MSGAWHWPIWGLIGEPPLGAYYSWEIGYIIFWHYPVGLPPTPSTADKQVPSRCSLGITVEPRLVGCTLRLSAVIVPILTGRIQLKVLPSCLPRSSDFGSALLKYYVNVQVFNC